MPRPDRPRPIGFRGRCGGARIVGEPPHPAALIGVRPATVSDKQIGGAAVDEVYQMETWRRRGSVEIHDRHHVTYKRFRVAIERRAGAGHQG